MSSYSSSGGLSGIIDTSLTTNYAPYLVAENNDNGGKAVMPFVTISSTRACFENIQGEIGIIFTIFDNSEPSFILRNIRTTDENVRTLSDYTIKLYARE